MVCICQLETVGELTGTHRHRGFHLAVEARAECSVDVDMSAHSASNGFTCPLLSRRNKPAAFSMLAPRLARQQVTRG